MDPHTPGKPWRVGDLARMTGLTVRTLHHYEAIGLLPAAAHSDGGHRLYDDASVARLYRIRVLRSLGMALAEIRRLIDDEASAVAVMQQHLARIEQEVADLTKLRNHLRRLCHHPDAPVDTADLLRTIDAMSRLERHASARQQSATTSAPGDTERQWRALGEQLRACMDAGDEPATGRVRALASRAQALIHAFAGDDAAVLAALKHVRTAAPPTDLAGWDPALMAYLDRALQALEEDGHAQ